MKKNSAKKAIEKKLLSIVADAATRDLLATIEARIPRLTENDGIRQLNIFNSGIILDLNKAEKRVLDIFKTVLRKVPEAIRKI